MATQDEIKEVIAEHLTVPVADIDPLANLKDDLGLGPVEVADLVHELADKFGLIFEPEDMEDIKSVGDLVEIVEDKLLE